jgi:hypothetical protein
MYACSSQDIGIELPTIISLRNIQDALSKHICTQNKKIKKNNQLTQVNRVASYA